MANHYNRETVICYFPENAPEPKLSDNFIKSDRYIPEGMIAYIAMQDSVEDSFAYLYRCEFPEDETVKAYEALIENQNDADNWEDADAVMEELSEKEANPIAWLENLTPQGCIRVDVESHGYCDKPRPDDFYIHWWSARLNKGKIEAACLSDAEKCYEAVKDLV